MMWYLWGTERVWAFKKFANNSGWKVPMKKHTLLS